MINLSDITPASPASGQNVRWQNDASGNVSAYAPLATVQTTTAPVAGVVTVDASLGNSFLINVTAIVTSTVITNPTVGQEITLLWIQDLTGYAVTLPANMVGGTVVTTTASKRTCQKFTYDAISTQWLAISAGSANM